MRETLGQGFSTKAPRGPLVTKRTYRRKDESYFDDLIIALSIPNKKIRLSDPALKVPIKMMSHQFIIQIEKTGNST